MAVRWRSGNDLAYDQRTLLESLSTVIRTLGSHTGKRIVFGYDRYLADELPAYREHLLTIGVQLDEGVDQGRLHYLTSAQLTCSSVQGDPNAFGILCCGTGMGMSIAANKFAGIYAARCTSIEDAQVARTINNSNVLCIAANLGFEQNRRIIDAFAQTPFTGRKLDELEYITTFEGPLPESASTLLAASLRRTA